MSKLFRAAGILGVLVAVLAAAWLNLFAPADRGLLDLRFGAAERLPSGEIVFVEIDAQSLAEVGVWPWPRSNHAALLDKLMDAGAREVVFDIDFSAASSEAEDRAFEAALERAGGYAFLAAFRQVSGDEIIWSYPLERFARYGSPVLVNVEDDGDGRLRSVPAALSFNGEIIPSIALALGQPAQPPPADIRIDFGIDLGRIERISAIDVLRGRIDLDLLADKQVVVGASALELRDLFNVPRFGIIPGPLAQIAAAETLLANRSLDRLHLAPAGVVLTLLALLALWRGAMVSPQRQAIFALAGAIVVEALALIALREWAVTFASVPIHAGLAGLVGIAFLDERAVRFRQHQRVRAQRATMQQVLSQVVTDSFDGIVVIDENGTIIAASDAAARILQAPVPLEGRDMVGALPAQLLEWLERADAGAHECACQIGQSQRMLEIVATCSLVPDPEGNGRQREVLCLTFQDITEKRRQAEQLTYLASHDSLTGALSRFALEEHIAAQLAKGAATGVLVRLDRLRNVSATLGHDVADLVLCQAHQRLERELGLSIGRLGSDLFAFSWPRRLAEAELERQFAALGAALEEPYELDEHTVVLGAQFGVSLSGTAALEAAQLLQHAEIALRSTVQTGTGNFAVFAAADGESMRARQALDIALRRALRQNEFFLVYQPQIDLASGEMIGVEALVRWIDPVLGFVSPAEFIPLAEETGLIVPLGEWVMREACREAAGWAWTGRLSVNVSAVQFKLADVIEMVGSASRASGFPVDRLDIEITESLYVGNDGPIIEAMKQLQAMGARIAIDDFGTGYSSLSYLSRLPADKLKIDQSFVRSLPDPGSQTIVETIITMAQRLGLTLIAEGVETAEQADYLRDLGCEVGQGYLFSRPVKAKELGLSPLAIAV